MDYILHIGILITIYSVLTLTMNILVGYLGILYLGHPAIYGIGAYTFAIMSVNLGFAFWPSLISGGVLAMIFGFILALPSLRLKSHYIGMTTFGFLIIMHGVFTNFKKVEIGEETYEMTRGALGIPGIQKPEIFGYQTGQKWLISGTTNPLVNLDTFIFILILSTIIFFILHKILHSPFSKVIETIREDETSARVIGKNVKKYKIQAFLISTFVAGIYGGLLASYIGVIDPKSFMTDELITVLAMVIIGGMASFWGSIIGALVIILLPEGLRFFNIENAEIIGALRFGIYGALIILFMIFRPNGIVGKRTNIFSK